MDMLEANTQRLRIVALIGIMSALVAGCATLSTVKASKGSGTSREYAIPVKTVWNTTLDALSKLELSIAQSNPTEGYILAQTGISALSWGERIAIFIDKIDDNRTRIEVVSKRVVATNIFAYDWEQRVLAAVDQQLYPPSAENTPSVHHPGS